jgi:hypothetical protein
VDPASDPMGMLPLEVATTFVASPMESISNNIDIFSWNASSECTALPGMDEAQIRG